MLDLDTLLGEYSVLEPSQRDDAPEETQKVWPEGHWAFVDTNGITAYFGNENDAFAFRMMKINVALNFTNVKEREPILFREEESAQESEHRDTLYDPQEMRNIVMNLFSHAPKGVEFKLNSLDGWIYNSGVSRLLGNVAREMVDGDEIHGVRFVRRDSDRNNIYIKE